MDFLHWLDACTYGSDAIENHSQSQAVLEFTFKLVILLVPRNFNQSNCPLVFDFDENCPN